MSTTISPEWIIFDRTMNLVKSLAAARRFVAAQGELVRSVPPEAVQEWSAVEGTRLGRGGTGISNIRMPAILITALGASTQMGAGLNCADDEAHRIAIQVVDSARSPARSSKPVRSYTDWMNVIRGELLTVPNPFLQDADVSVYDPFVVHILRRLPAEAEHMVRHEQRVAMLTFQVMVRFHR